MSIAPYISLGNSILAGYSARSAARAQQTVLDAEAKAANTVRQGANTEAAAKSSLANYMRGENNRRILAAAGKQSNAAVMTLARTQEAFTQGDLESQISAAEQAGAYAANAAMSGTAGASVDVVDYSIRAQQERSRYYRETQQARVTYDQLQQIVGIMPQALSQIDFTSTAYGLDYGTTFARQAPKAGNFLADILNWSTKNPTAVGAIGKDIDNFFKAPADTSGLGLIFN